MNKNIALLTDTVKIPNIALMKLSLYHKSLGDSVDWFVPLFAHTYDKVYYSKLFSFSSLNEEYYLSGDVEKGGTGVDISKQLPEEIDELPCDYSIYPDYKNAIGFITRGCIRNCSGCVVPKESADEILKYFVVIEGAKNEDKVVYKKTVTLDYDKYENIKKKILPNHSRNQKILMLAAEYL